MLNTKGGPISLPGTALPECPVCGGDCNSGTVASETSLFPTRSEMVQSPHPVYAPHRIVDEENQRVAYAPGDPMTDDDARKYLGIEPTELHPEPVVSDVDKRAKRASADRAKRLENDRAVRIGEDR